MTCRDARPLLPLFVDGELDGRQMRGVALHSARCPSCEEEVQSLEKIQEAVAGYVSDAIEEIDFAEIWAGVEPRLTTPRLSLATRVRDWFERSESPWAMRVPLAAAAIVMIVFVFGMLIASSNPGVGGSGMQLAQEPEGAVFVLKDNDAVLDSIESDLSVAVLSEPRSNTLVLWVSDESVHDPTFDELGELP